MDIEKNINRSKENMTKPSIDTNLFRVVYSNSTVNLFTKHMSNF